MKIRVWDEERNKMVHNFSETFGSNDLYSYIIGQSVDNSIEVFKEGENSSPLPIMEFTGWSDNNYSCQEIYEKDIMKYFVLGESRKGIVVKRATGEWVVQVDLGCYIGLFSALKDNNARLVGNWYKNKELMR